MLEIFNALNLYIKLGIIELKEHGEWGVKLEFSWKVFERI